MRVGRLWGMGVAAFLLFSTASRGQDSLNVMKVGEISYWYGAFEIVKSGDYAYASSSYAGMRVVNVSDPSNPYESGFCDTPGNTYDLAIMDSFAFVADQYDIRIINISDPSNPIETYAYDPLTGLQYNLVELSGNILFAGIFKYLASIDITDPINPVLIATVDAQTTIKRMIVQDSLLYLARLNGYTSGTNFFEIYDVSDPANMYMLDSVGINVYCMDMAVSNGFAYLSLYWPGGLRILNVSNPSNIQQAYFFHPYNGFGGNLFVDNEIAYWGYGDYPNYGTYVLDVTNPASPVELQFSTQYGTTVPICIDSPYGYCPSPFGSFSVFNLSDPCNWIHLGSCGVIADLQRVAVEGNFACAASGYIGIRFINISDPSSPVDLGNIYFNNPVVDVTIENGVLYTTVSHEGLYIIDITDPSNPVILGYCQIAEEIHNLDVWGEYAYIANSNTGPNNGLNIVYVGNPLEPVFISNWALNDPVYDVKVVDTLAYVAASGHLWTVDVSDPLYPTLVGACHAYPVCVDVVGDYAYLAQASQGLQIIDISQPSSPVAVGNFPTPGWGVYDVDVEGNFAYIADYYNGLKVINVSDPVNPTLYGFYDTDGKTLGVAVSDDLVYLADMNYFGIYDCGPWNSIEEPARPVIPSNFSLVSHPNPFNPLTVASFELRVSSHVSLRVYDTAARFVRTLVDGWRPAGKHQAVFDSSGLPSGIYLAWLTAGDFQQTQKLILLK